MRFIIKKRVRQMQRKERIAPVVKYIRKSILYAKEAYEVIKGYIPDHLPEHDEDVLSAMRIVKMELSGAFYWLCEYEGIYYAVKIGTTSELIITPIRCFDEIPMSMTIEIVLKDCSRQTGEDTALSLSVFYDADIRQISLQTLNLCGKDIRNFSRDYWKIHTVPSSGCGDGDGCCGSIRYVRASEAWEMNLGGLEIYNAIELWTGSKTLKIFKKEDEGFTIKQMLNCWEKFWEAFGH